MLYAANAARFARLCRCTRCAATAGCFAALLSCRHLASELCQTTTHSLQAGVKATDVNMRCNCNCTSAGWDAMNPDDIWQLQMSLWY
jgi:hypothetical protein